MTQMRRLFFATRLDARAKSMASNAMQHQIEVHRLHGKAVSPELMHTTLHWLGDHEDQLPGELLGAAEAVGGSVDMAPFGVGFDRIGSVGDPSMGGLALMGRSELAKLRELQRELAKAMRSEGIGHHVRSSFNPHVSLFYSDGRVVPEPIAPIRWEVSEVMLIESLVGQSTHVVKGRWPLLGRQAGFPGW